MGAILSCQCGRQPEQDTSLRGKNDIYKYSLSCKCGGEEINFLARSDNLAVCIDNWNSRITGAPFKHAAQELPTPDADVIPSIASGGTYFWDSDPYRRYVRERGGFCSGGGGPS